MSCNQNWIRWNEATNRFLIMFLLNYSFCECLELFNKGGGLAVWNCYNAWSDAKSLKSLRNVPDAGDGSGVFYVWHNFPREQIHEPYFLWARFCLTPVQSYPGFLCACLWVTCLYLLAGHGLRASCGVVRKMIASKKSYLLGDCGVYPQTLLVKMWITCSLYLAGLYFHRLQAVVQKTFNPDSTVLLKPYIQPA